MSQKRKSDDDGSQIMDERNDDGSQIMDEMNDYAKIGYRQDSLPDDVDMMYNELLKPIPILGEPGEPGEPEESEEIVLPKREGSIYHPEKYNRRRDVNSLQKLYNGITSPFGLYIVDKSKTTEIELSDQLEYSLDHLNTIRTLLKMYAPLEYAYEEIEIDILLRSGEDTYTYDNDTTVTRVYKLTDRDADNIIATMLSNVFHLSLICISLVNPTLPAFSIGYGYSAGETVEEYHTPYGNIQVKQQSGGIYVLDQVSPTPDNPSVLTGAKILRIDDIRRINDFLRKGSLARCRFQKKSNGNYKLLNIIISGDDIPKFAQSGEIDRIEKQLRSMGVPKFDFINRYNCVRVGSRKLLNLLLQCGDVSLPGHCPEVDEERYYLLRDLIFSLQRIKNKAEHSEVLGFLTGVIEDIDRELGITELGNYTEAHLSQLSRLYADSQSPEWESFHLHSPEGESFHLHSPKRSKTKRSKSINWESFHLPSPELSIEQSAKQSLKWARENLSSSPERRAKRTKKNLSPEEQSVQWESYGGRKTKNKKRKYKYTKKNGKKHNKMRGKKSRRRSRRKQK